MSTLHFLSSNYGLMLLFTKTLGVFLTLQRIKMYFQKEEMQLFNGVINKLTLYFGKIMISCISELSGL